VRGAFLGWRLCGVSVRGPWRRFSRALCSWTAYHGCPFARRLAAPTTASSTGLVIPSGNRLFAGDGTCLLRTTAAFDVPWFVRGLTSPRTSTCLPPLGKSLVMSRLQLTTAIAFASASLGLGAVGAFVPFCFIGHPASVPYASFRARGRKRRSAHDARSRSRRSGCGLRSQSLPSLPLRSVAAAPGERGVGLGTAAPSRPSHAAFAGGIPAKPGFVSGDIHVAACSVTLSRVGASCGRFGDTSCGVASLPKFTTELRMVGIQPKNMAGILPTNEKGHLGGGLRKAIHFIRCR